MLQRYLVVFYYTLMSGCVKRPISRKFNNVAGGERRSQGNHGRQAQGDEIKPHNGPERDFFAAGTGHLTLPEKPSVPVPAMAKIAVTKALPKVTRNMAARPLLQW